MAASFPFRRFQWVIPRLLARSSAPHYISSDSDQNMDQVAADALVSQGIHVVISVNQLVLPQAQRDLLEKNNIQYHHFPIPDFTAPTMEQLRAIWGTVKNLDGSVGATLVYCGYGHGRTGTVICALQMALSKCSMTQAEYKNNHVETQEQQDILDQWGDQWVKGYLR